MADECITRIWDSNFLDMPRCVRYVIAIDGPRCVSGYVVARSFKRDPDVFNRCDSKFDEVWNLLPGGKQAKDLTGWRQPTLHVRDEEEDE